VSILPVDKPDAVLLRLIDDPRPSPIELGSQVEVLKAHIADAKFSSEVKPLKEWARNWPSMVGKAHPSKPEESLTPDTSLSSLEWHAIKHTATGEWAEGTSVAEYEADIRSTIRLTASELSVGRASVGRGPNKRSASRAGVRTDMGQARPIVKKAANLAGYAMFVVYDPARRCLLSGYQLPRTEALGAVNAWNPSKHLKP